MTIRTMREARVQGKRVFVRAELNVVRDRRGRIVDDTRLQAVLPTIRWLKSQKAKVIILTHLGRPNGRTVRSLSTRMLARPLSRALGVTVRWQSAAVGPKVEAAIDRLSSGQVLLLENVRFYPGEENNDPVFVRQLAALADLLVLECFGTAHRRHASVFGLGRVLPTYAGRTFAREVSVLSKILRRPRRPFVAILGGAKISSKIGLISRLLPRVNGLLLGGALANTILQAQGLQIGRSVTEPAMLSRVRRLRLTDPRLHIPVDVMVSSGRSRPAVRAVGKVQPKEFIYDIGPSTIELFRSVMASAGTVVWNGPMGKYEQPPFNRGTLELARAVAKSPAFSVVGGGETVDAIKATGTTRNINFISTGGGAMIEFLQGRTLPGVEVVMTNQ